MTKRSNQIYKYVKTKSAGFSLQDLKNSPGLTAKDVADELGLIRNNVSKELNELVKEQILVKIKTKPVYFFDRQSFENLFQRHIKTNILSLEECQDLILAKEGLGNDPFLHIIGSDASLKNQVERAKAAIMYPPNGLNCLIIGETGVGKTLFAKVMYEYAKFTRRYTENAPFITFNCADLYNNPQLLLSQLFGHLKGAFTGADNDKVGLIENADGGILFLDEIHRL
ncbi:MAG: sigma 54-interacting transcriptional regulator, partial [Tepidanaerobacteraceae bacterium]|nr:sigma 54-interacting transcriptional regulator [Tepidanaerobacteraceae bacterium]